MKTEPFWLKSREVTLNDGTAVTLRPEEEKDIEPVWKMFSTLSEDSLQYLPIPFTRERIEGWFKEINYDRRIPILGVVEKEGEKRIIASATLAFSKMEHYKHVATFGITVHDDYQGRGLGSIITEYLIEVARAKELKKIALDVVTQNSRAINVYRRHGFKIEGRLEKNHWNYILNEYGDEYVMGLLL